MNNPTSALARFKEKVAASPLYLLALWTLGRAPGCPVSALMKAVVKEREGYAAGATVKAQSHLIEEDSDGERWSTPYGEYWVPKRQVSSDFLFNLLGEREVQVYGGPGWNVKAGDIVIDCGANVGTFVVEALENGARLVVACEPSPSNAECLRRNFGKELSAGQVIIYPRGLWDSSTTLRLALGDTPAGDSLTAETGDGMEVPVTTIDALVAELNLERVDFVKMDIEGAERRALAGATTTIRRFHPRLAISAYHLPDDPGAIKAVVKKAFDGYTLHCSQARPMWNGLLHTRVAPLVYFFSATAKA